MYVIGVIYHIGTDQITRRLMIQGWKQSKQAGM